MSAAYAFPLEFSFRLLALSPQLFVRDASGQEIAYVRQKLFRLKELVKIFPNQTANEEIYTVEADRILDFSGGYHLRDAKGTELGMLKQHGVRSLWRAHFSVVRNGQVVYEVSEKSVLTRMVDNLLGEVPVLGLITGYVFQPSYLIKTPEGQCVMQLDKKPALWEGVFEMHQHEAITNDDQELLLLAMIMVMLLERRRG